MKTYPHVLAIVADHNSYRDTIEVGFPSAKTLGNWDRLTIDQKRVIDIDSADNHTIDLHPSPAAYLAGLESLPEPQQRAGRAAFANAIEDELLLIEHFHSLEYSEEGLSTKDALGLVNEFIDKIGGPDLAKIHLKTAARDFVSGKTNIPINKEVAAYVERLTSANTISLVHSMSIRTTPPHTPLPKPIYGAPKPQNVPSDMQDTPPAPCDFKVGDRVTFINDYGVKFPGKTVRGFTKEVTSWGAFIYWNNEAWWHPSKPCNFRHERLAISTKPPTTTLLVPIPAQEDSVAPTTEIEEANDQTSTPVPRMGL